MDQFQMEQQLIPKFGAEINEAEFSELQEMYKKEIVRADAYLANDSEAVEAGMESYVKFNNYDNHNEQQSAYRDKLFFNSKADFPWQLQAYEWYLNEHQSKEETLIAEMQEAPAAQSNRMQQLLDEEKFAVYTDIVTDNFKSYKTTVAIVIFISIAILISQVFIRDTRASVVPLQYACKKGRTVYQTKWIAGLLSGILLTVVLLSFYMMLYMKNDTKSHFDLPLTAFGWNYYWYDITFWQYILLSVGIIFMLSVILTILTMAISSLVPNMIVLIASQIVVQFIMIAGGATVIVRNVIDLQYNQQFVPSIIAVSILIILLIMWFVWKREKSKDII
ncbi:hypothetical protein [Niallia sp. BSM11]|uniref:hypothetical protein n=1 Tax=Niallia sp. BSM11 TaxID=3391576 RepID=UPI00398465F0